MYLRLILLLLLISAACLPGSAQEFESVEQSYRVKIKRIVDGKESVVDTLILGNAELNDSLLKKTLQERFGSEDWVQAAVEAADTSRSDWKRSRVQIELFDPTEAEMHMLRAAGADSGLLALDFETAENIVFYPRSGGEWRLRFDLPAAADALAYEVRDAAGMLLHSGAPGAFSGRFDQDLDMGGINGGVFYVLIRRDERALVQKFQVNTE